MLTLVVEFGRQREKFQLKDPINVDLLENEIKSNLGLDHGNAYLIEIFDEQIDEYLDLTSTSFLSRRISLFKGQIISRQFNPPLSQTKVSKEQVMGLITLKSCENSLQKCDHNYCNIVFVISLSSWHL